MKPTDRPAPALQVSYAGGLHPTCRGDGRELFYLGPDDEIMAVEVRVDGDSITTGEPQRRRVLLNIPDASLSLLFIDGVGELLDRGR